jgi:acyl-CoA reductase-like NAD-dependent aldehyde dehydrogenase
MTTNGTNGTNGNHASATLSWDKFYNVIDGKLETTQKTRHSINPATGKPNPEVPIASNQDADRALQAAKTAFKKWSAVPYRERQAAVNAFADALDAEKESFTAMLTQEQGKPVSCSLPSHRRSID